jgi:hypothetical protein
MSIGSVKQSLASAKANHRLGITEIETSKSHNDTLLESLGLMLNRIKSLRERDIITPMFEALGGVMRAHEAFTNGTEDIQYAQGRNNVSATDLDSLYKVSNDLVRACDAEMPDGVPQPNFDPLYKDLTEITSLISSLLEKVESAQSNARDTKRFLGYAVSQADVVIQGISNFPGRQS